MGVPSFSLSSPTYLLADLHLEEGKSYSTSFLHFLNAHSNCQLILLGDLFSFWTAIPASCTPFQQQVLDAIEDFRSRGSTVIFLQGNRDLWFKFKKATDHFTTLERYFDWVIPDYCALTPVAPQAKNDRILLHHGDLANTHDWGYRVLRFLARNALIRRVFLAVSEERARSWIYKLPSFFAERFPYSAKFFPIEAWQKWSLDKLRHYHARSLMIGHFHPEHWITHSFAAGERAWVAPAWFYNQSYAEITADGEVLFKNFHEPSP